MNNINYQTPKSNLIKGPTQQSTVGKWLAIIGSILLLALPIGLISTIISMVQLFQDITLQGTDDPKLMAGGMSSALISTVLGLVVALTGAILLCVSILFFKHRKPWVFRVSLTAAVITLFLFPIGTIVSIIILIVLFRNKSSFYISSEFPLNDKMEDVN